jgi:hypothetical protein
VTARCPKCDAAVPDGAGACRACGLATDRFDSYQRVAVDAPPVVVAAWQACAAAWDEERVHEAFCAAVSATGAFAFAAQAYRGAARERPGDARAADGLARVQRLAEVALLARTPSPSEPSEVRRFRGAALVVLALCLIAALGAVALLIARTSREQELERPAVSGPRQRTTPPSPHQ